MRLMRAVYRRGYARGYDAALDDLMYSPESRKALFHIMMMDGYKPRRIHL